MAGKFFFSAKEDEKLVECVAAFPALYDSEDRYYKDRVTRENSWEQIAANVQRSTEECKKRWRNIKDTYFKLKRNKNRSGLPARSKSRWPLLEQLIFLDNIIIKRRSRNNKDTNDYRDESNDGNISSLDDSNDCSTLDPLRTTTKRAASPVIISPKKGNSFEVLKPESEISEAENIENISWRDEDEDPILLFFKSLALTVKTFEPHIIPEVKSRIFNIVNEFEIRAIQNKHNSSIQSSSRSEVTHLESSVPLNIETKYSFSSSFHHNSDPI